MIYNYLESKEGKRRFNNKNLYYITYMFQNVLHFIGIAWHNSYSNECTKDFNCCTDIGKFAWLKIRNKYNK
jgi:hypothetical protein